MNTYRYIFRYLKKRMPLVIASILFALGSSLTALYVPIIFGDAIDILAEDGNRLEKIVYKLALAGVIVLITALMQWLTAIINNKITYEVVKEIRNDVFVKLQKLPLGYLDIHPTGEIVSRMISDTDTFADGLLLGFTQGFTGIVTIIGTLIYMWSLSRVTTVVVVVVTPLSLFVARFIATRTHDLFIAQSKVRGEQTAIIDEMIGEERTVKSLGYEKKAIEEFDEVNERLGKISLKALFYSSLVNPSTRFVNSVVYALVALVGGFRALSGLMSIGSLTALLAYATQYTKPFNEISGVLTELQNAVACVSRVFELLNEQEEAECLDLAGQLKCVEGNITIKDVAFSYVPEKPLIGDFDLNVQKGQTVAIVGPTGCGKTTLINLLMRFYDVNGGSICVDGVDIRKVSRHELRSNFGMVLQDTWIMSGTVLDNIMLGRKNATREEAIEAAKAAHAHSFIRRLPKGYDTVLSEGGGELSQGQKQLLCITRVMLALPPILILDEATSSIDTRTEIRIQKAFHKLMEGRTSFIVAHRLSTIMDADVIIVMKDGHIMEQGSHEELLEKGGFYSELFMSQFAG
ncbi:MAG: ABC transporter ATP-binding protein/permease [Lachnospiraceae bacterium]|nr:ABC transporter ATP-binding protein/permease [Lachnospiraceae bacterium]